MSLRFDWWKWLVIMGFSMLVLSMFCRCTTTKYIPQIEYRYVNKTDSILQVDSVWLHDSTSVYIYGDTIFKDRWHYKDRYKFIYKNKSDTLLVRDSIPYKVEVEKQLSKTDKFFIGIGRIATVILFIAILAFIGWIYKKKK